MVKLDKMGHDMQFMKCVLCLLPFVCVHGKESRYMVANSDSHVGVWGSMVVNICMWGMGEEGGTLVTWWQS